MVSSLFIVFFVTIVIKEYFVDLSAILFPCFIFPFIFFFFYFNKQQIQATEMTDKMSLNNYTFNPVENTIDLTLLSDEVKDHYKKQIKEAMKRLPYEGAHNKIELYKPNEVILISKEDFLKVHDAYLKLADLYGTSTGLVDQEIFHVFMQGVVHCEVFWDIIKKRNRGDGDDDYKGLELCKDTKK